MEYEASMHHVLERLLHDESAEPTELPLSLLSAITNNFADAQKIGEDEYFVLYEVLYVSLPTTLCLGYCWLQSSCECHGRVCFKMEKSL
jgi:hypothetical protein